MIEGPEFVFSIIIVDDIKAIAVPLDTASLRDALCKGYRIQCDHGDYGTDKERFIADHPQLGIATPCPAVVSTQEIWHTIENLLISPNPGGEEAGCTFTLRSAGVVMIDLLDFAGRLRQSRRLQLEEGTHRIIFAAGDLPPGLYMVRLHREGRFFSAKWVKH